MAHAHPLLFIKAKVVNILSVNDEGSKIEDLLGKIQLKINESDEIRNYFYFKMESSWLNVQKESEIYFTCFPMKFLTKAKFEENIVDVWEQVDIITLSEQTIHIGKYSLKEIDCYKNTILMETRPEPRCKPGPHVHLGIEPNYPHYYVEMKNDDNLDFYLIPFYGMNTNIEKTRNGTLVNDELFGFYIKCKSLDDFRTKFPQDKAFDDSSTLYYDDNFGYYISI